MSKIINEVGNVYGRLTVMYIDNNTLVTKVPKRWICKCKCGKIKSILGSELRRGRSTSCGCRNTINEVGNVYGKLTVLKEDGRDNFHSVKWLCKCECGTEKSIVGTLLRSGQTKSCGCISTSVNEAGNVYGRLTVIERSGINNNNDVTWSCKCECGNNTIASGVQLRKGEVKSCGCITNAIDEIGNVYGKLTVIGKYNSDRYGINWLCRCNCGRESVVKGVNLRRGITKSCGCSRTGSKTHGLIYGIVDDDDKIIYIGKTVSYDIRQRFRRHMSEDCVVSRWYSNTGTEPKMKVILNNIAIEDLDKLESFIIKEVGKITPLLNVQGNSKGLPFYNSNVALKEWSDIIPFIEHLLLCQDNLQLVSKDSHKIKSYAERMGISYEKAVIEKKYVIPFKKLSAEKQKKELISRGATKEQLTTQDKRVSLYRQLINEEKEKSNENNYT